MGGKAWLYMTPRVRSTPIPFPPQTHRQLSSEGSLVKRQHEAREAHDNEKNAKSARSAISVTTDPPASSGEQEGPSACENEQNLMADGRTGVREQCGNGKKKQPD